MDASKNSNEQFHDAAAFSSKSLEKIIDDSQYTGELLLSGRKLSDLPKSIIHYDLSDLFYADLSKNCLVDFPCFLFNFLSLEHLNCYHNSIRSVHPSTSLLKNLVQLNLSRNQLTHFPSHACHLACLQVLNLSNNRLRSLPNEVGSLAQLMEIDVSNNQLTELPDNIQHLTNLKCLDIHKNFVTSLNAGICKLKLMKLDISVNHITHLPANFDQLTSLDVLIIHDNPLIQPPPHVAMKGRQHIMTYVKLESLRRKAKMGVEESGRRLRKGVSASNIGIKSNPLATDDIATTVTTATGNKVLMYDSGYNATDNFRNAGLNNVEDKSMILHYGTLPKSRIRKRGKMAELGGGGPDKVHYYNYYSNRSNRNALYKTNSEYFSLEINSSGGGGGGGSGGGGSGGLYGQTNNNTNFESVDSEKRTQQSKIFQHSFSVDDLTADKNINSIKPSAIPTITTTTTSTKLIKTTITSTTATTTTTSPATTTSTTTTTTKKRLKKSLSSSRNTPLHTSNHTTTNNHTTNNNNNHHGNDNNNQDNNIDNNTLLTFKKITINNDKNIDEGGDDNDDDDDDDDDDDGSESSPTSVKTLSYHSNEGVSLSVRDERYMSTVTLSLSDVDVEVDNAMLETIATTTTSNNLDNNVADDNANDNHSTKDNKSDETSTNNFHDIGFIVDEDTSANSDRNTKGNRGGSCNSEDLENDFDETEEFYEKYTTLYKRRLNEASKIKKILDTAPQPAIQNGLTNDIAAKDSTNTEPCTPTPTTLSPRVKRMLDMMSRDMKEHDPVLTIRRNLQQVVRHKSHVKSLKRIVESVLKIKLPGSKNAAKDDGGDDNDVHENDDDDDDGDEEEDEDADVELGHSLRDGVLLCRLANALVPLSITNIYTPIGDKKLSEAKCRKNVEKFLLVCKKMGMKEESICMDSDILEWKNVVNISRTVTTLIKISKLFKSSAV